jgi:hypothetical protein
MAEREGAALTFAEIPAQQLGKSFVAWLLSAMAALWRRFGSMLRVSSTRTTCTIAVLRKNY